MAQLKFSTKCATAERLDRADVYKQHFALSDNPKTEVLNFFPLPVLVVNSLRQVVFINYAFLQGLGLWDVDYCLAKRPGEIVRCLYANTEDAGCGTSEYCRQCGALHTVLESIELQKDAVRECQLLLKTPDNTMAAVDLRVSVSPWIIENDTYYVVSFVDISDEIRRKVLERVFFHDILNTAAGASGIADILLGDATDVDKPTALALSQALHGMVEEIQCHKELLEVEKGEYSFRGMTIQGLEMVRSIVQEFRSHSIAVTKDVSIRGAGKNIPVYSDFALLRRVLVNMVLNALEASPANGTVTVGIDQTDGKARFRVHSEAFIPKNLQVQLFKRSFSTKGESRGLGTYSIKLLTENYLKGRCGFTSDVQTGTTFWITIPTAEDYQPDASAG